MQLRASCIEADAVAVVAATANASDESLGIYGPGHNSFTVDDNGEDICVYHARSDEEIEGDPLYNPNRHARLMKIGWDRNGAPVFTYR